MGFFEESESVPSSDGTKRLEEQGGQGIGRSAKFSLRSAEIADAAGIWRLVRDGGRLELNSPYAYVLLASDFRETCWVAEGESGLAGFVAAYRPPSRLETVFVWQIGVAAEWRGLGVGSELLFRLATGSAAGVRYLEATVTPSNEASQGLFRSFARRMETGVQITEGFPASLFPDNRTEPESLFRIGPFAAAA